MRPAGGGNFEAWQVWLPGVALLDMRSYSRCILAFFLCILAVALCDLP